MADKITWALNPHGVRVGVVGGLELFIIGKPKKPFDDDSDVRLSIRFGTYTPTGGMRLGGVEEAKRFSEETLGIFYRKLRKAMEPEKQKKAAAKASPSTEESTR
jgi:hypothetical protein